MGDHILEFDAPEAQRPEVGGGKLAGLAVLTEIGARVPAGFGVACSAYREWLTGSGLGAPIDALMTGDAAAGKVAPADVEDAIGALLSERPMPAPVAAQIRARYQQLAELLDTDEPAVAVRSSATSEDAGDASFAGEYATYLGVQGADAVCDAVHRCWVSSFSRQAIAYAASRGLGVGATDMAVVIQALVPATTAGVMFTLSPVTGDRSRIVVEAAWGLGTSVVGGEVTPDRYVIDKVTLDVASVEIGDKVVEHRPDEGVVTVDDDRRTSRCLTDAELRELATLGKRLERTLGHPLDIEWAVDPRLPFPESVVLLQCRPETLWSQRKRDTVHDPAEPIVGWISNNMVRGQPPRP